MLFKDLGILGCCRKGYRPLKRRPPVRDIVEGTSRWLDGHTVALDVQRDRDRIIWKERPHETGGSLMDWTWEGMLTELGYAEAQRKEIIARIAEFDRREDIEAQELFREYPIISAMARCKTLEDLNRLLDSSSFDLRITYAPCGVLILADRLYGLGIGMAYYLKKCTAHNVLGVVYDFDGVVALAKEYRVDVLIVAGLQSNRENYRAVEYLRRRYSTLPIMWAGLDRPVRMVCEEHNISTFFDRHKRLEFFAEYVTELSPCVPCSPSETAPKPTIPRWLSRLWKRKNTTPAFGSAPEDGER